MFDSLREKISKVQDGITASFRGLAVGEPLPNSRIKPDLHAGADLLAEYQSQWEEIHNLSESNARLAQRVDGEISRVHNMVSKRLNSTNELVLGLATIDRVITSVEIVVNQIGDIRNCIENVEHALLSLEDLIEDEDLKLNKLKATQELTDYKKEKLEQLDKMKALMSSSYQDKVKKMEDFWDTERKAKQELYDKKFKHDIEEYKRTGVLPLKEDVQPGASCLEEVSIVDTMETTDLEDLLSDIPNT